MEIKGQWANKENLVIPVNQVTWVIEVFLASVANQVFLVKTASVPRVTLATKVKKDQLAFLVRVVKRVLKESQP